MCEEELVHNLLARVNDLEERVAALELDKRNLERDLAATVERRDRRERIEHRPGK